MKNLFKRVTSFITALAMTMTLTGGVQLVSFAEETYVTGTIVPVYGSAYADPDESALALEGYINKELAGGMGMSMFNFRSSTGNLTEDGVIVYNELYSMIEGVAAGTITTSEFEIVLECDYPGLTNEDEVTAAATAIFNGIDFDSVYMALLADMPYELYWHDKTQGYRAAADCTYDGSTLSLINTVSFYVSSDYAGMDNLTLNDLPARIDTAVDKMNEVVTSYAGQSTLAILTGYKEEICSLTDYNDYAADDNNNVAYGDPWQLIHVFDGNPETTVVCEGYSKAFKQLCDMTDFSNDVYCFLAKGDAGGPHMWNIVQIGTEYYHADVTNSDEGTVGSGGGLFLDGVTYTDSTKTAFNTEVNLSYTFDEDTLYMYSTECASLSATDYSEAPKTISSIEVQNNPTKTEYYINEEFDPTGLVIRVNYSDYSYEDVTYSAENDKFTDDFSEVTLDKNQTSVMVTYDGQTAEIPVTVSEDVVLFTEDDLGNSGGYGWSIDNNTLRLDTGCIGYKYIFECEYPYPVQNNGTIISGTFNSTVFNYGTIEDGTFNNDAVYNHGTITGGTFNNDIVYNYGTIEDGTFNNEVGNATTITGGTFNGTVYNDGTIEDGTFDGAVENNNTISGGTFDGAVYNYGTITGGTFEEVNNYDDLSKISLTTDSNGGYSAVISKTTGYGGTVTVDGNEHEHNENNAIYSEYDENSHTKTAACENCPINYVGSVNESHSVTVFTASDNVITANCVCGQEMGTFTLEAPADLTYNGEAKEATVTVAGEVGGEATPTVEYYIGNEKLDAAPTNRGTYTAKITVDDATAELEFTIGAKNISVATVTVTPLEYTGAAQSADIVLKDGDYTLVKDTDYSITGTSSATDAGTYNVTITGINNYQGSFEETWTITKAIPSIGEITITPNPIYDSNTVEDITLTYENSAAIPGTLTVNNGRTLTAGQMMIDWTFTPSDTLNYETMVVQRR
ncbi:MAG: hypothetical protein J6A05_02585 [Oscillospiraceae bacterium]|nr:hypothetical protein [Oscillospiraceae bacterium]